MSHFLVDDCDPGLEMSSSDLILKNFKKLKAGARMKVRCWLKGKLNYQDSSHVGQGDPGYECRFYDYKMTGKDMKIGNVVIPNYIWLGISDKYWEFLYKKYWEHDQDKNIEITVECMVDMYFYTEMKKKGKKEKTILNIRVSMIEKFVGISECPIDYNDTISEDEDEDDSET